MQMNDTTRRGKMITNLTPKQEATIPVYREMWLKSALCPSTDRVAAEAAVDRLYRAMGWEVAPIKIWMQSPLAAGLAVAVLGVMRKEGSQLGSQLWSQLWSQLGSQLDSQLGSQLRSQLGSQLWSQLGSQLDSQLGSQLWSQLDSQLWSQLGSQLRSQLWSQLGQWKHHVHGHLNSGWAAYTSFIMEVLGAGDPEKTELLRAYNDVVKECALVWPSDKIVVFCEKPVEVHWNEAKRLHKDGGMAARWSDDWGVYALGGVRMEKDIVMTPARELRTDTVFQEKNAEVRAQIIKKIGLPRLLSELNSEAIDTHEGYELHVLDLKDGRRRPYLKMINPSTGEIHVEGVHPDCQTVGQSLAWRNGAEPGSRAFNKYSAPEVLT